MRNLKWIRGIGQLMVAAAFLLAISMLGLAKYQLTTHTIDLDSDYHMTQVLEVANQEGKVGQLYDNAFSFISDMSGVLKESQAALQEKAKTGIPEGVESHNFVIGDYKIKEYLTKLAGSSLVGPVAVHSRSFLTAISILLLLGALLSFVPLFASQPGIKNDGIYFDSMTRGAGVAVSKLTLGVTLVGLFIYGMIYMNWAVILPILTVVIGIVMWVLLRRKENYQEFSPARLSSGLGGGALAMIAGFFLIVFYVLLYWFPEYLTPWVNMVDSLSMGLSGNAASRWFLYGLLYTLAVVVMGVRMFAKYKHSRNHMVRTGSVMFFQVIFAFLLPEILVKMNQPYFDFKNIWPLDYDFFFDYNINTLVQSGNLGLFMLVWGILLIVVAVPVLTYLYGKRWYCSWVCGCGALAETLGDPYRQLSDKSMKAWKWERYIIYTVLVFAVVMTLLVLYSYFTGRSNIFFLNSYSVRTWYGFLIGSAFAGVIGTGFYPFMGNRVWCRFGCPLAATLGIIQKFKSRFRITVNGGQCISCGNCSTYCEMGIDVRHYAQRGQDIVRASCVGCGVCAAVCPRGVLRLENAGSDIGQRTEELRTLHISEHEVKLLS